MMTVGDGEKIVVKTGFDKGHIARNVNFNAKGYKMYLDIGPTGNVVVGDPATRAAILRYNPDGTGQEVFAAGLRNPVGLRFYPGTDQIWTSVQERDGLGDGLVPDFFTSIRQGGFYGWPYAYLGPNPEPRIEDKDKRKDLVDSTITPDVFLDTHVAVLDFVFYTGKQFPAQYRGGAFLANHGSSNPPQRGGRSITSLPFKHGQPSAPAQEFLTGFMLSPDQKEGWGRPLRPLQMSDGSLLLSEDGRQIVLR